MVRREGQSGRGCEGGVTRLGKRRRIARGRKKGGEEEGGRN